MFSFYFHQNSEIYRNYESTTEFLHEGHVWIILFLKKDKHNIPFLKKINKQKIAWNTSELIFLCQQIDPVLGKDKKAKLCEAEKNGKGRCAAAHRATKSRWRSSEGATVNPPSESVERILLLSSFTENAVNRTDRRPRLQTQRESLRHCFRHKSQRCLGC